MSVKSFSAVKSSRSILFVALPVVVAVVLIFALWQRPTGAQKNAQSDGVTETAQSKNLAGGDNAQSESAGNKIDSQADTPGAASLSASLAALFSAGIKGGKPLSVAEILANPDPLKSRSLATRWNRIQSGYTDFLKSLNLSDEQVTAIEEQLLRKEAVLAEVLVYPPELRVMVKIDDQMSEAINTVDTSDWPQKRSIVTAASDAVVQPMLQNNSQFEVFKAFENTEFARAFVDTFNSSLSRYDEVLTSTQSGQLAEAFYLANPNYGEMRYMMINAPSFSPELAASLAPAQLMLWNKLVGDLNTQSAAIQAALKNK